MRTILILFILVLSACYADSGSTKLAASPGSQGAAGAVVVTPTADKDELIIQQREIIRKQTMEMERQKREMDDLRRQEFHNDRLREFQGN